MIVTLVETIIDKQFAQRVLKCDSGTNRQGYLRAAVSSSGVHCRLTTTSLPFLAAV